MHIQILHKDPLTSDLPGSTSNPSVRRRNPLAAAVVVIAEPAGSFSLSPTPPSSFALVPWPSEDGPLPATVRRNVFLPVVWASRVGRTAFPAAPEASTAGGAFPEASTAGLSVPAASVVGGSALTVPLVVSLASRVGRTVKGDGPEPSTPGLSIPEASIVPGSVLVVPPVILASRVGRAVLPAAAVPEASTPGAPLSDPAAGPMPVSLLNNVGRIVCFSVPEASRPAMLVRVEMLSWGAEWLPLVLRLATSSTCRDVIIINTTEPLQNCGSGRGLGPCKDGLRLRK